MVHLLSGPGGIEVIQDVVVAMAAAFVAALASTRLRIPLILGFLVAGALIGPESIGLVRNQDSVHLMAEIGVVFLLFTIGLRFPLHELIQMRRVVLGAGVAQVVLTAAIGVVPFLIFDTGIPVTGASLVLFGSLLALSSTAIVLRSMEQRGEINSAPGRVATGVLLFQDIAAVILIVVIPSMAGKDGAASAADVSISIGSSLLMVALVFLASRMVLPRLMTMVLRSRSADVFSLATVLVVIGTAYLCGMVGVALALGAFMAGIVISESETARQVMADVRTIKDVLSSLFFVSIGLLVDPAVVADHWLLILLLAVAVLVVKTLVMGAVGVAMGYGVRVAITAAVWLSQIGEFSFVLAQVGMTEGLMTKNAYGIFIAVTVLTMGVAPLLMPAGPWLGARLEPVRLLRSIRRNKVDKGLASLIEHEAHPAGHVIIVGFGVSGRNVDRMLTNAAIPTVIVELNPDTVKRERGIGRRIFYGDAARPEVLRHAGAEQARAIVVALPDGALTAGVVATARALNPDTRIIARTRMLREVETLYSTGASAVVPEEFESSLELAAQAMDAVGASSWGIAQQKHQIRQDHYHMLTAGGGDTPSQRAVTLPPDFLMGADMATVTVTPASGAIGKTIQGLRLRSLTGATVIAAMRGCDTVRNPGPDFQLAAGDTLFLFGSPDEIGRALDLLGAGAAHTTRKSVLRAPGGSGVVQ